MLFIAGTLHAQEIGFGCLGLVGGFAGYGVQQYQPDGINTYMADLNILFKDSIATPLSKFQKLQGYRLGLNFFRENYTGFIFTFKGVYQFMSEKQEVTVHDPAKTPTIHTYEVRLKNFGIGVDIGMEVTKRFHWKVVDVWALFNVVQFQTQYNSVYGIIASTTYHNPNYEFGYSLGTGFIYYLIDKYISVEGSVGFSNFHTNTLKDDAGNSLRLRSNNDQEVQNAIKSGGLLAIIQINFSFPL
jgi:hypothetical protein